MLDFQTAQSIRSSDSEPLSAECRIAHFRIERELGKGGCGWVYQAVDESLGRRVAIKVIHPEMAKDVKALRAFMNEARAAAAINHPHVVQVYFVGEVDGQPYIVMEWLQGRTLDDLLNEAGRVAEAAVASMALQATRGLQAGCELGFIHRDIKPENLFLDERHGLKILDFGLAALVQKENILAQNLAKRDYIFGSPYYLPPERVTFDVEDHRGDIYSLGASLYHALAGAPPFEAEDAGQLAAKRLFEQPVPLAQIASQISPRTSDVVARMLNRRPEERQQTYEELYADWSDVYEKVASNARPGRGAGLQDKGVVATPNGNPAAIPSSGSVSGKWIPRIGVISTVVAFAILLVLWLGPGSGRDDPGSAQAAPRAEALKPASAQLPTNANKTATDAGKASLTDQGSPEEAVSWQEVTPDHVGRTMTVTGIVIQVTQGSKASYLYFSPVSDGKQDLNVAIFNANLPKFPEKLRTLYLGKEIQVSGTVSEYRGRPQFIVDLPKQIRVLK